MYLVFKDVNNAQAYLNDSNAALTAKGEPNIEMHQYLFEWYVHDCAGLDPTGYLYDSLSMTDPKELARQRLRWKKEHGLLVIEEFQLVSEISPSSSIEMLNDLQVLAAILEKGLLAEAYVTLATFPAAYLDIQIPGGGTIRQTFLDLIRSVFDLQEESKLALLMAGGGS